MTQYTGHKEDPAVVDSTADGTVIGVLKGMLAQGEDATTIDTNTRRKELAMGDRAGDMTPPEDLCAAAVKVARRLQSLTNGCIYNIILVKDKRGNWQLAILSQAKVEAAGS